MAEVLSLCRGKTRFEQFRRSLARNDMVRQINRCDRHMNRIFERFMVSDFLFGHASAQQPPDFGDIFSSRLLW